MFGNPYFQIYTRLYTCSIAFGTIAKSRIASGSININLYANSKLGGVFENCLLQEHIRRHDRVMSYKENRYAILTCKYVVLTSSSAILVFDEIRVHKLKNSASYSRSEL